MLDHDIVRCRYCGLHVVPKADGFCPSCQHNPLAEPTQKELAQKRVAEIKTFRHVVSERANTLGMGGSLFFIGGLLVTCASYGAAVSFGGRFYLIARGAIFFGFVQLIGAVYFTWKAWRLKSLESRMLDAIERDDSA